MSKLISDNLKKILALWQNYQTDNIKIDDLIIIVKLFIYCYELEYHSLLKSNFLEE